MTRTKHAKILEDFHGLLLEALRSREQEIFHYLAILGPALAGFGWLLYKQVRVELFIFGTIGVLLLLLLGAVYSLALGYNFRYITLELAKLEKILGVEKAMLVGWPKSREKFLEPEFKWCKPPEVIAVFWYAFLVGIALTTITAIVHLCQRKLDCLEIIGLAAMVLVIGSTCFLMGLSFPKCYARKINHLAEQEPLTWSEIDQELSPTQESN